MPETFDLPSANQYCYSQINTTRCKGGGMHKRARADRATARRRPACAQLTVGAAVCAVLYGLPLPAEADQTVPSMLEEVTVTATRRALTPEEVPYSLSVIDGEQLARTGVIDIQSLALQVPGLSM